MMTDDELTNAEVARTLEAVIDLVAVPEDLHRVVRTYMLDCPQAPLMTETFALVDGWAPGSVFLYWLLELLTRAGWRVHLRQHPREDEAVLSIVWEGSDSYQHDMLPPESLLRPRERYSWRSAFPGRLAAQALLKAVELRRIRPFGEGMADFGKSTKKKP